MLPLDKLLAVKKLITHANCPDGIASALIIRHVMPDVEVKFVAYGTQEHEELPAERHMLFCDFAPPAKRAMQFVEAGTLVLDHHRTAKDLVAAFETNGVYADEDTQPGVSGASLAFEHVWKPLSENAAFTNEAPLVAWKNSVERFAIVAGVRDTWQKNHPAWELACRQAEMLRFFPVKTLLEDPNFFLNIRKYEDVGDVLMERQKNECVTLIRDAYRFDVVGKRVVVIPSTNTSDVAEMIGEDADLVIGFRFTCDSAQKINLSLRSRGTYDCASLAKKFGGGGHRNAAGFTMKLSPHDDQPFNFIESMMTKELIPF